jgi:hypothetical protein
MPLDSDSLGSLRIDRSAPAERSGLGKRLLYIGGGLVLVALIAAGLWFWLGAKTTEVTTVTAEADSSGPSLGNSVLNASGYVVARRMATVSAKVTGKVQEILVEEGMAVKKDQVLARLDPVNIQTVLTCRSESWTPRAAISPRSKSAWPTRSACLRATKSW